MKVLNLILAGMMMATGTTEVPATATDTDRSIALWPDGAPGALGHRDQGVPTITPFLIRKDGATSRPAAVLVCPGGGYGGLAAHEGPDYARWLNELGVSAFVLEYRLGSAGYRHPAMLQ